MNPKRVATNLSSLPGRSRILQEPLGQSLILGTWNYPLLINLQPLVSAIGAGNTVILKPSEHAQASSRLLGELFAQRCLPEFISVVEGGVDTSKHLLDLPFDKIFFTGSAKVGKIVMKAASQHLSNVTLELGGKSPAVILRDANLKMAASRIAWGKYMNAGQTCIAPDYVLIHEDDASSFIALLKKKLMQMYGDQPLNSPDLVGIINREHYIRLLNFKEASHVAFGGDGDDKLRKIAPAILYPVNADDSIMKEEIFGPLLPIVTYRNDNEAKSILDGMETPLAFYLFTTNKTKVRSWLDTQSFGSACVNDVVMQFSNPNLPFGGKGSSGFGRYHQLAGLEAFSNAKSILYHTNWFEPSFKYPPFTKSKFNAIRWVLK